MKSIAFAAMMTMCANITGTQLSMREPVTFKNETIYGYKISFQGESDSQFGTPYAIPPKGQVRINLVPGKYRVKAKRSDGQLNFHSWRKYSSRAEPYHISLCAICATDGHAVPAVVTTSVPRLGVSITDSEIGVRVLRTDPDSPADSMHIAANSNIYYAHPLNSIITRVNGHRIEDAIDFLSAISDSPKRCNLTIFSTTQGTTTEFWTALR